MWRDRAGGRRAEEIGGAANPKREVSKLKAAFTQGKKKPALRRALVVAWSEPCYLQLAAVTTASEMSFV